MVGRRQSPRTFLPGWGTLGLVLPGKLTRGRAALHLGIGSVTLGWAGWTMNPTILTCLWRGRQRGEVRCRTGVVAEEGSMEDVPRELGIRSGRDE